jgi:predicted ATPase
MNKKIILLIGGPSSGKTTLINHLEAEGHICYPEISREVILKAREEGVDYLFLENPMLFSERLLEGRIKQYQNAVNEEKPVFIDRGIPDVVAYMDFIGDSYPAEFIAACETYKYDKVFLLPPWEEIYTSDAERYESYEEASKIHNYLVDTYTKYGYELHEVPKTSVTERFQFIINHIKD